MIKVYYHAYPGKLGLEVVAKQLRLLSDSGLEAAADEIHIGCGQKDSLEIASLCPRKARIHVLPDPVQSELPTMRVMIADLSPGHLICYFHTKGSSHAHDMYRYWREQMERACIQRWRECVEALNSGYYDVAGTRWSEPVKGKTYPPGQRYFQGNCWWAKSDYLMGLAPLIESQFVNRSERENRFEAEVWIGKSKFAPKVFEI